ncbi:MAG: hypothetical protein ACYSUB_20880 [Planctomycetota bacterium]|jgi:hypothetical protein
MKFPIYCIVNDKAVKAVRTKSGGVEVLVFYPEDDEFRRDMRFLDYIYLPSPSQSLATDIVSKKEFEAYVAKLRTATQAPGSTGDHHRRRGFISWITKLARRRKGKRSDIRQQQNQIKKWTLEGYDAYACEFYRLKGEYKTEADAITAAKEIRRQESSDWVYVVAPDGSHYRFSR